VQLSTSATNTVFIRPEARKIIITQLPQGVYYHQLEQLIRRQIASGMSKSWATRPHDQLHELKLVMHPDKNHRGHAIAILGLEQIARSVVEKLDGKRFQGRELKVRFTKEGVESSAPFSTASETSLASPYSALRYQTFEGMQPAPSSRDPKRTLEYASAECAAPPSTVATLVRVHSRAKREYKEIARDRDPRDVLKKKGSSPLVVDGSWSERESKSSRKYRGY
jgi:hypothetical protein